MLDYSTIKELLQRPARKQVIVDPRKTQPIVDGTVYNIWYNNICGGDRTKTSVDKALHRCNLLRDIGKTKSRDRAFICIHFARGACTRGAECYFVHCIPTIEMGLIDKAYDCFGRERHKDEKEDMSGVGTFERENRTLYVANINSQDNVEEIVTRHFSEWGEVENVKILTGKGMGFVRFKHRFSAEFAKEAMLGQALDQNEVLNVKWAADDPNDKSHSESKKASEERVMETIRNNLPVIGDKGTLLDYQNPDDEPEHKRLKLEDNSAYQINYDDPALFAQYYEYLDPNQTEHSVQQYNYSDDDDEDNEQPMNTEPQPEYEPQNEVPTMGLVQYGSDSE